MYRPPNLCDWKIGLILLKNRKEIAFPIGVCSKIIKKIGKSYQNMSWAWSKFRFFPPNSEWLGDLHVEETSVEVKSKICLMQLKMYFIHTWKCVIWCKLKLKSTIYLLFQPNGIHHSYTCIRFANILHKFTQIIHTWGKIINELLRVCCFF